MRRSFAEAWAARLAGRPLTPLEHQIADVVEEHPEYHALLEATQALEAQEFTPELGRTNPFLHMAMHLAIRDQRDTDRPAGIQALYRGLAGRLGPVETEHRLMECLGEALWQAQRSGMAPDETAYLECVRSMSKRG
jgi:hypothetical protein